MPAPTFVIIGAARCGTTSMARWLDAHPDVFITKPKEVFFFSHEGNYHKGWAHYLKLYENAGTVIARGEATTDYSHVVQFPDTPKRIAKHIPDCRLIYMVRHPVERIASQWALARSHGSTSLSLSRAVFGLPELIQVSHYLTTMQAYLNWFSEEQICTVMFEDFTRDPRSQAQRCLSHIGVDPDKVPMDVPAAPTGKEFLRQQWRLVRRIRGLGVMQHYRTAVPESTRARINSFITRRQDWVLDWDRSCLNYVRSILEADSNAFLERFTTKPEGYWSFAYEPVETQRS